ncbi:hypothetical protein HPB48_018134 [Haemaphysalis longicornis]|uniref:Uncharacterized protein n=1 Tax=Haemaphysalis longicornis TaxID=44386 RepID=A0A9J6FT87_HAELO|nr:hypothetical protein HPB48_018134 [Haemaphysalis longicornis]
MHTSERSAAASEQAADDDVDSQAPISTKARDQPLKTSLPHNISAKLGMFVGGIYLKSAGQQAPSLRRIERQVSGRKALQISVRYEELGSNTKREDYTEDMSRNAEKTRDENTVITSRREGQRPNVQDDSSGMQTTHKKTARNVNVPEDGDVTERSTSRGESTVQVINTCDSLSCENKDDRKKERHPHYHPRTIFTEKADQRHGVASALPQATRACRPHESTGGRSSGALVDGSPVRESELEFGAAPTMKQETPVTTLLPPGRLPGEGYGDSSMQRSQRTLGDLCPVQGMPKRGNQSELVIMTAAGETQEMSRNPDKKKSRRKKPPSSEDDGKRSKRSSSRKRSERERYRERKERRLEEAGDETGREVETDRTEFVKTRSNYDLGGAASREFKFTVGLLPYTHGTLPHKELARDIHTRSGSTGWGTQDEDVLTTGLDSRHIESFAVQPWRQPMSATQRKEKIDASPPSPVSPEQERYPFQAEDVAPIPRKEQKSLKQIEPEIKKPVAEKESYLSHDSGSTEKSGKKSKRRDKHKSRSKSKSRRGKEKGNKRHREIDANTPQEKRARQSRKEVPTHQGSPDSQTGSPPIFSWSTADAPGVSDIYREMTWSTSSRLEKRRGERRDKSHSSSSRHSHRRKDKRRDGRYREGSRKSDENHRHDKRRHRTHKGSTSPRSASERNKEEYGDRKSHRKGEGEGSPPFSQELQSATSSRLASPASQTSAASAERKSGSGRSKSSHGRGSGKDGKRSKRRRDEEPKSRGSRERNNERKDMESTPDFRRERSREFTFSVGLVPFTRGTLPRPELTRPNSEEFLSTAWGIEPDLDRTKRSRTSKDRHRSRSRKSVKKHDNESSDAKDDTIGTSMEQTTETKARKRSKSRTSKSRHQRRSREEREERSKSRGSPRRSSRRRRRHKSKRGSRYRSRRSRKSRSRRSRKSRSRRGRRSRSRRSRRSGSRKSRRSKSRRKTSPSRRSSRRRKHKTRKKRHRHRSRKGRRHGRGHGRRSRSRRKRSPSKKRSKDMLYGAKKPADGAVEVYTDSSTPPAFWCFLLTSIACTLILIIGVIVMYYIICIRPTPETPTGRPPTLTYTGSATKTSTQRTPRPPPAEAYYCTSDYCTREARYIRGLLRYSVHPCDNFYEHVCEAWKEQHPAHSTSTGSLSSQGSMLQETLTYRLLDQLKKMGHQRDVRNAVNLHKACVDSARHPGALTTTLHQLFAHWTIGTWPRSTGAPADITEIWLFAAELLRDVGIATVAQVSVSVNPDKQDATIVQLDRPSFLLREANAAAGDVVHLFEQAVSEASSELGVSPPGDFGERLMRICAAFAALGRTNLGNDEVVVLPFSGLSNSLRTFLGGLLENAYIRDDENVALYPASYFRWNLEYVLQPLPPEDVLNYLGFLVLVNFAPFLSDELGGLRALFADSVMGRTIADTKNTAMLCAWLIDRVLPGCTAKASHKWRRSSGQDVGMREWLSQLEVVFLRHTRDFSWINELSSLFIRYRLKKRTATQFGLVLKEQRPCAPLYIGSERNAVLFYWNVTKRWQQAMLDDRFSDISSLRRRWSGSELSTEVTFRQPLRTIHVPATLFNSSIPTNSAAFVFHLARVAVRYYRALVQLLHDDQYELDAPLSFDEDDFRLLSDCFGRASQADSVDGGSQGEAGLRRALLDQTSAILLAVTAFEELSPIRRVWNLDLRLKGLENITATQLFFIYFALDNCESTDPAFHQNRLSAMHRVNLPLKQLRQFGQAFRCGPQAPMVATSVCSVTQGRRLRQRSPGRSSRDERHRSHNQGTPRVSRRPPHNE